MKANCDNFANLVGWGTKSSDKYNIRGVTSVTYESRIIGKFVKITLHHCTGRMPQYNTDRWIDPHKFVSAACLNEEPRRVLNGIWNESLKYPNILQ